jgi:hypothetical protein
MSLALLSATRLPNVANECSQQTCSFKDEEYNSLVGLFNRINRQLGHLRQQLMLMTF